MHSRTKLLTISVTAVVVVLSVFVGLAYAVNNSYKLAAALTNLSTYINNCSYHKDIALVAFLFLLLLWRALLLRRSQS